MKIPQVGYRGDGDVKGAVGQITVVDCFPQESDSLVGDFYGIATGTVNTGNLTVFYLVREHGVILFANIFTALQHFFIGSVKNLDSDHCIKEGVGIDLILLFLKSRTAR